MTLPATAPRGLRPVTTLRIAIIVVTLASWEALSASGLLYRDVVPSLLAIAKALFDLLTVPDMPVDLSRSGCKVRPVFRRSTGTSTSPSTRSRSAC